MGLFVSIQLLPGVRLGGRLTGRRRGPGLIASTFIGMAKLLWWVLLFEVYLVVGAALFLAAFYWLLFVLARFAILTVLNRPVQTPRDAIRQMQTRISTWRARR